MKRAQPSSDPVQLARPNPSPLLDKGLSEEKIRGLNDQKRLVESHRRFSRLQGQRISGLLDKSDKLLEPLADPLRLAMADHRWLDPDHNREESYSDWLAWILQTSNSSSFIFRVFGLNDPRFAKEIRDETVDIERETQIPIDDEGDKRTDIIVRCSGGRVLLIEVKIRDLEEAGGRKNLRPMADWLERKQRDPNLRKALLLLPEKMETPEQRWDVLPWEDVCLHLRREAKLLVAKRGADLCLAASMLAFCGAVEQNICEFDSGDNLGRAAETARYLEKWLGGKVVMDQRESLLRESGPLYPHAMAALGRFRTWVEKPCIEALDGHRSALCKLAGIPLDELKAVRYASPDRLLRPKMKYRLGAQLRRGQVFVRLFLYYNMRHDRMELVYQIKLEDEMKRNKLVEKIGACKEQGRFTELHWRVEGEYKKGPALAIDVRAEDFSKLSEQAVALCSMASSILKQCGNLEALLR